MRLLRAALLACAMLAEACRAAGPGTLARTLTVGGSARSYALHVPAGLAPERPAALVLMFHGGGGTPAFAERDSRFSELAEREGFIVAYPEGLGRSWNDGRDAANIVAQREAHDDVAFVAALIDDIARDHRIDARRIYATGISNGAIFSHYLAARLSARIAAIAPVAGGLPAAYAGRFAPEQPVSVLILQGTADPLVPYDGGDIRLPLPFARARGAVLPTGETVRKWVEHDGAQRQPVIAEPPDTDPNDGCRPRTFTHAGGRNGSAVVLYRLEGGGHAWPGGLQYLPRRLVGAACRDFDASAVIWDFFKAHPKP